MNLSHTNFSIFARVYGNDFSQWPVGADFQDIKKVSNRDVFLGRCTLAEPLQLLKVF